MAVTAQDAIEALRELERRLPDMFTMRPGATDAEPTEAEPRLPDDIRPLLRAVSAVRVAGEESLHLDPRLSRVERRWMWGPGEETRVILSRGRTRERTPAVPRALSVSLRPTVRDGPSCGRVCGRNLTAILSTVVP